MSTRQLWLRAAALLVLSLLLAACATSNEPNSKSSTLASAAPRDNGVLPTELNIAHPALYRAWQGKEPMAMRPYYADDAVVITPSGEFRGWNDLHTRWLTPTLPRMSNFMAMPANFIRNGEEIVESRRYTFTITDAGKAMEQRGHYSQRWSRQPNGMWRIVSANITADKDR